MVHYRDLVATLARQTRAGAVPRQAAMWRLVDSARIVARECMHNNFFVHGRDHSLLQPLPYLQRSDKDVYLHLYDAAMLHDIIDVLARLPAVRYCADALLQQQQQQLLRLQGCHVTRTSRTLLLLSSLISDLRVSQPYMPHATLARSLDVVAHCAHGASQLSTGDVCSLLSMYLRMPSLLVRMHNNNDDKDTHDNNDSGNDSAMVDAVTYWRASDVHVVEQLIRHLLSRLPRGDDAELVDDTLSRALRPLPVHKAHARDGHKATQHRYMSLREMRAARPWQPMTVSEFVVVASQLALYSSYCTPTFRYYHFASDDMGGGDSDDSSDGSGLVDVDDDAFATVAASTRRHGEGDRARAALYAMLRASKQRTLSPSAVAAVTAVLRRFTLLRHTRRIAAVRPLEWAEWCLLSLLLRSRVDEWMAVAQRSMHDAIASVPSMATAVSPLDSVAPHLHRRFFAYLCSTVVLMLAPQRSRVDVLRGVLYMLVTPSSRQQQQEEKTTCLHPAARAMSLRHLTRFVMFLTVVLREHNKHRELDTHTLQQLLRVTGELVCVLDAHMRAHLDRVLALPHAPTRSAQWPWLSFSDAAYSHAQVLHYRCTVCLLRLREVKIRRYGQQLQQMPHTQAPPCTVRDSNDGGSSSSASSKSGGSTCTMPHALLRQLLLDDIPYVLQRATAHYTAWLFAAGDVLWLMQVLLQPTRVRLYDDHDSHDDGSGGHRQRRSMTCFAHLLPADEQRSIFVCLRTLLQLLVDKLPSLLCLSPLLLRTTLFVVSELSFLWRNALLPHASQPLDVLTAAQLDELQSLCRRALIVYVQHLGDVLLAQHRRHPHHRHHHNNSNNNSNNNSGASLSAANVWDETTPTVDAMLNAMRVHRAVSTALRVLTDLYTPLDASLSSSSSSSMQLTPLLQFLFDHVAAATSSNNSGSSKTARSDSGHAAVAAAGHASHNDADEELVRRRCLTTFALTNHMCKLHCGDDDDTVVAAAARALRSCTSESQLRQLSWAARVRLLPSITNLYDAAHPHLAHSRSWRSILLTCIVATVRLSLDRVAYRYKPPMHSNSDNNNTTAVAADADAAAMAMQMEQHRARCAEFVWVLCTRIVFTALRDSNLDTYLSAMLRFVRRYHTSPATFAALLTATTATTTAATSLLRPVVVDAVTDARATAMTTTRTSVLSVQAVQRLNEHLMQLYAKDRMLEYSDVVDGDVSRARGSDEDVDDDGAATATTATQPTMATMSMFSQSLRYVALTNEERVLLQCNLAVLLSLYSLGAVRDQLFARRSELRSARLLRIAELYKTFWHVAQRNKSVLLPFTWVTMLYGLATVPRLLTGSSGSADALRSMSQFATQHTMRYLLALCEQQQQQQQQQGDVIDMALRELARNIYYDHRSQLMRGAAAAATSSTVNDSDDTDAALCDVQTSPRLRAYVLVYLSNCLDHCDANMSTDVRALLVQLSDRVAAQSPMPVLAPAVTRSSSSSSDDEKNDNVDDDDAAAAAAATLPTAGADRSAVECNARQARRMLCHVSDTDDDDNDVPDATTTTTTRAAALLVLLTGLPAAGKSTFLRHLCATVVATADADNNNDDDGERSSCHRRVRIAHVHRLDDYLAAATASSTGNNNDDNDNSVSAFAPTAWHAASQAMYSAVHAHLQRLLVRDDAQHDDLLLLPPLVVVEDNMHYYSMRERYWKLCRRVGRDNDDNNNGGGGAWVAMLELYFDVPLQVCVQRNAQRQPALPEYVLHALHARTDARHTAATRGHDRDRDRRVGCWALSRVAQPWALAVLHCDDKNDDSSSDSNAVAATATCSVTPQTQCNDALALLRRHSRTLSRVLHAQCARHAAARAQAMRDRDAAQARVRSRASATAQQLHRLDLELRACVTAFYAQPLHVCRCAAVGDNAMTSASLRQAVQRAKHACLTHVRAQLASTAHNDDDDAQSTACQQHLAHFHARLYELLQQQQQQR